VAEDSYFKGKTGTVTGFTNDGKAVVRFDRDNDGCSPSGIIDLKILKRIDFNSVAEELNAKAKSLGLTNGKSVMPDLRGNDRDRADKLDPSTVDDRPGSYYPVVEVMKEENRDDDTKYVKGTNIPITHIGGLPIRVIDPYEDEDEDDEEIDEDDEEIDEDDEEPEEEELDEKLIGLPEKVIDMVQYNFSDTDIKDSDIQYAVDLIEISKKIAESAGNFNPTLAGEMIRDLIEDRDDIKPVIHSVISYLSEESLQLLLKEAVGNDQEVEVDENEEDEKDEDPHHEEDDDAIIVIVNEIREGEDPKYILMGVINALPTYLKKIIKI
jgi:hypothetical protein